MKNIPVADVRNVVIAGHTGSGKTALTDALLYKLGLNDRLGSVAAGSSMADYSDEEKSRKITIFAKPFMGEYKTRAGTRMGLVFIDTPGYMDFFGQVIAASHATEAALITISATAGVQVGTLHAWKCAESRKIARGIIVTGLDRENADFAKTVEDIRAKLGDKCVPVMLPTDGGKAAVELLGTSAVPAPLAEQAATFRSRLVELAAESDETLTEKFLLEGSEALTPDEVAKGLKAAVRQGGLVPVFICVPTSGVGVVELLEGLASLFPSPDSRAVADAEGKPIATAPSAPFTGFVWRTVNDPFVGQITFVRVLGGTLTSDSEIHNAVKGQKERIGSVLVVNGKKQSPVESATAGDVVALPKLKFTGVNDTLCAVGQKVVCAPIKFPNPVLFMAVTAKTQADEDKIGTALARVCEEDPTLKVIRNTETKEMVIQGLGDVHIDVAVGLMKSRSNVEVVLSTPKVPYRETVTATGEGHYKHKKQSGGRGQYGEVYLRVAPKRADDEEWFEDAIVGGVIPNNFIPAVQKGVVEGMVKGSVAGYPVTDVKSTLHDGSFHDVDSSEISFKIAGARAFKDAMSKARPVLLEPIMTVKVMIPEQYLGDVNGDLNHKRGRIMGMEMETGVQIITAEVPQAELFRYAAELRSMTGGQGSFDLEFTRYDIVPSNIAQKIVASAQKDKEEEE